MLLNLLNSGLCGGVRGQDADIRPQADDPGDGRGAHPPGEEGRPVKVGGRHNRGCRGRDRGEGEPRGARQDRRGRQRRRRRQRRRQGPRCRRHADATNGVALIILQSTLLVLQDVGEEKFMQSADFPVDWFSS